MFASQNTKSVTIALDYDPAADEVIPLWRAPKACEITAAYATVVNDVSANTANYFSLSLLNGGSAGTATTALGGSIGGTGGWTGLTPVSFTISEGTLTAGDVVVLSYDEEGTGTFAEVTIQLDYVDGVGA